MGTYRWGTTHSPRGEIMTNDLLPVRKENYVRNPGYELASVSSLLKAPLVVGLILIILFGPVVLTSFAKTLPMIPLHIWIVAGVIIVVYHWLK